MQTVWAREALTAEGWCSGVSLSWDESGRITSLQTGCEPGEGARVELLLPAMANLHSHAFQRAMAGLTERRGERAQDSFWTWRQQMYRFVEAVQPQDIEAIAAMVQCEMLEAGYASVAEFHYLHHDPAGRPYANRAETSERVAAAAASTGIGLTLLPVLYQRGGCDDRALNASQRRFGHSLDDYLSLQQAAATALRGLPRDSRCAVALHSLRAVAPAAVREVDQLFSTCPVHIHVAEQVAEVDEVLAATGARPVQWLLDNCRLDPRWCLVHATHLDDAETAAAAASGAVAGLCPITEANLGDGIFNGVAFREAGGLYGVGSDSNVRIALAEELRLLEYSQRLQQRRRTLLVEPSASNGRALYDSALAGGARALGRDSGRLAVGCWADMLALDGGADCLIERRGDAVLDSWLFAGDDRLVRDVWSAGRHLVSEGRHRGRDAIRARFEASLVRLAQ